MSVYYYYKLTTIHASFTNVLCVQFTRTQSNQGNGENQNSYLLHCDSAYSASKIQKTSSGLRVFFKVVLKCSLNDNFQILAISGKENFSEVECESIISYRRWCWSAKMMHFILLQHVQIISLIVLGNTQNHQVLSQRVQKT